jgi:hypothetical protein
MRDVIITKVANGFIVKVGCQSFVFNKIENVAEELIRYSKNPGEVEKEYNKEYKLGLEPIDPIALRTFNYHGVIDGNSGTTTQYPSETAPSCAGETTMSNNPRLGGYNAR